MGYQKIYTLDALCKAYQSGENLDFLFFYGHRLSQVGLIDASCLSPWYWSRFVVDDVAYTCTQHFLMAEKTRLLHDSDALTLILKAGHPDEVKQLEYRGQIFEPNLWDGYYFEIIRRANMAKFTQNSQLGDYLTSTQGKYLVEADPDDADLGIGMPKDHPDIMHPDKWRGKNLLGFTLSKVRDCIIEQSVRG